MSDRAQRWASRAEHWTSRAQHWTSQARHRVRPDQRPGDEVRGWSDQARRLAGEGWQGSGRWWLRSAHGKRLAGRTRGWANHARGLASRAQGLASRTQGLASRTQGLASRTQGLASRAQGLASRARGWASSERAATIRASRSTWQWLVAGFGVLVMLAVCGLGTFFIVLDERRGQEATGITSPPAPTAIPRDISSRVADPEPLTSNEVFPERQIVINSDEPPYQVLKTQTTDDCRTAAAGEIARLLVVLGCDQVVRGTLRSPNRAHLVTTGIFNLTDLASAEQAHREIKAIVEDRRGRFHGMAAGAGTEPVVLASAQVGWHVRGHFLVYCVIARADGAAIIDGDPFARQILFDMIELHLRGEVLERRATQPLPGPDRGPARTSRAAVKAASSDATGG